MDPTQIQKYLGGLDFPVDKEQVISHAQSRGADEQALQALRQLPAQRFNSANDISQAMGNT